MSNGGYVYVSSDAAWHPLYPSGPTIVWDVYNVDTLYYDASSVQSYSATFDLDDNRYVIVDRLVYSPFIASDGTPYAYEIPNYDTLSNYEMTRDELFNSYSKGTLSPGYVLRRTEYSNGDGEYLEEGFYWQLLGWFVSTTSSGFGSSKRLYVNYYAYSSTPTNVKGSWIQAIESTNSSAYPDNGIHTDGKWYVKQT